MFSCRKMVRCQGHPNDCASDLFWSRQHTHMFSSQCATKSVILHLQWTEEELNANTTTTASLSPVKEFRPLSPSLSTSSPGPRSFSRAGSLVTPGRRSSLATARPTLGTPSSLGARGRHSLGVVSPSSPLSPLSPSPAPSPMRFGRAAVLTAPPKLVGIVETTDVAVGAVDPRKRRVVTATRFSHRLGANRRVCRQVVDIPLVSLTRWVDLYVDAPR